MAKRKKSTGWMDRLLRPLKRQQVTLTQAGKKQAPMRKGKPTKKPTKKAPPEPLTVKERQARELKTMYNIGLKDPERLAQIISRMLQEANMQEEQEQLKFERLVWEKAEKRGQKREDDETQ